MFLKPKSQRVVRNRQKSDLGLQVITRHHKYSKVRTLDQILLDMSCHSAHNHKESRPGAQCGGKRGDT